MLIIMTVDHLGGLLALLTLEPLGYVSAAEGFVFLSGYMYALVYARRATTTTSLRHRSVQRAKLIYRYHILCFALVVGLTLIFPALNHYWHMEGAIENPIVWGLASVFLLNTPIHFDILPMYVFFVLATPGLVWCIKKGLAPLVMAASLSLWLVGRFVDPLGHVDSLLSVGIHTQFFNLLAWQLIWTLGILLGYYREAVKTALDRLSPRALIAPALLITLLFLARHHAIPLGFSPKDTALARDDLGWLRLLDFLAIVALATWFIRRVPIDARLPWLAPLGRASIQVFTFHLLLIYFTLPIEEPIKAIGGASLYALYTFLCVLLLGIPAYIIHQRRRAS